MRIHQNPELARLARDFGIHFEGGGLDFMKPEWKDDYRMAMDAAKRDFGYDAFAYDAAPAQPLTVTSSNAGIPWFLANIIDPKQIEVLVTPMKFAEILREEKKGDWTTMTWQFPLIESTGDIASYGDYQNSGEVGAQVNFITRQSYYFQTITEWGERELAQAGLAKIDIAARKNISAALTMNKFQNKTYAFGVTGLQLYGLLNDPSLQPSITPLLKSEGTSYYAWPMASANEVYADIEALFQQLVIQTAGIVQLDTKMILAMSPASEVALTKTTQFNVNVADMLKKNFPNLRVETAVEYTSASGNLVQLIAEELDTEEVATCAFNEKLRAHAVVREMSSFKQKKSGGTWGALLYQPLGISSMLGV
jgi:hypothetical protein